MPREGSHDRGRRLLAEARLTVTRVEDDLIDATCRGDSGEIRRLGYRRGQWSCSCPARTECAHLVALKLVVVIR